MSDKSPRSTASKKSTKSIKEKRADKRAAKEASIPDNELVAKVRKR